MKFLFVASLHHPKQLQRAIEQSPANETPPRFPPSTNYHFWERALRHRGHTVEVFYRNASAFGSGIKAQQHTTGLTPTKVIQALLRRFPAQINPDYRLRNARLIALARKTRPDILWLVGDNTVIYPQTLATIKQETGCKLIYGCGTSPIVFSHAIERQAARLYDLVVANDYYHGMQWLELGVQQMVCLPGSACEPDFHRPYDLTVAEHERYTCDIAFVGTLVPDNLYQQRVQALETLREFDLGIWSVHEVPVSLRPYQRGAALGLEMVKILSAAKICLNIHGDFMRYGGNMRLFEAAGVGAFQIADDLPGIHEWFTPDETIITYRDLDDLRAKVVYYLEHADERQTIATAAQDHVYMHHTYDQRVLQLEELLKH